MPWTASEGWHVHWHPAKKKGYTGVAVWSRKPMRVLGTGLGDDDDDLEGERNICKLADVSPPISW